MKTEDKIANKIIKELNKNFQIEPKIQIKEEFLLTGQKIRELETELEVLKDVEKQILFSIEKENQKLYKIRDKIRMTSHEKAYLKCFLIEQKALIDLKEYKK